MRKLFSIAVVIALLLSLAGISDASVGYKKDGENIGNAVSIDFKGGHTTFDGSTVTFYANGYKDGVTTNVSTESNLTSAALAYGVIKLQAGSAKYIALAAGTAGQMVNIIMTVYDGGTVTITDDYLSSANQTAVVETGWDDIAFNAVNDQVTLLYFNDTVGWIVVGQYGVAIT